MIVPLVLIPVAMVALELDNFVVAARAEQEVAILAELVVAVAALLLAASLL